MTVSEACSKLFGWFAENERFDLSKDYKSLLIVSDDEEVEKEIVKIALAKMEEIKILIRITTIKRDVWVLDKPLNSFEQSVSISGNMAAEISEVINRTCHAIDNYDDVCNPLDINEKDINNLIFICQKIYEHDVEKNDLT
jgi:hypothetical protein